MPEIRIESENMLVLWSCHKFAFFDSCLNTGIIKSVFVRQVQIFPYLWKILFSFRYNTAIRHLADVILMKMAWF